MPATHTLDDVHHCLSGSILALADAMAGPRPARAQGVGHNNDDDADLLEVARLLTAAQERLTAVTRRQRLAARSRP